MILVIFLEARPRAGAIKATQATQATDLMVFPAPGPAGSGRAQTLPRWLLHPTDCRIPRDRTGPDLDERPLYFSMSQNRAIVAEKSMRSSPLGAARLLTTHSWAEAPSATRSERACRMAISRNARRLLVHLWTGSLSLTTAKKATPGPYLPHCSGSLPRKVLRRLRASTRPTGGAGSMGS